MASDVFCGALRLRSGHLAFAQQKQDAGGPVLTERLMLQYAWLAAAQCELVASAYGPLGRAGPISQ